MEDQEQVDKVLEIREKVPHGNDFTTMRGAAPLPAAGSTVVRSTAAGGQQLLKQQPTVIDDENKKRPATDGAMFYTSGTTGNAKGVVLGYDNLIAAGRAGAEMEALSSNEEVLAYLPMAWVGQNIFSYTQWLVCGFTVNCRSRRQR